MSTDSLEWKERKEISDRIFEFRKVGQMDEAISKCLEVIRKYPKYCFYYKILGDLYFQKNEYANAAAAYVQYLSHAPLKTAYFAEFAKRYHRLQRALSKDNFQHFVDLLADLLSHGKIPTPFNAMLEALIINDVQRQPEYSEDAIRLIEAIKNKSDQKILLKLTKILETDKAFELERIFDEFITTRERNKVNYQYDVYAIAFYERIGRLSTAAALANDLLAFRHDPSMVRTLFRVCRKLKDYTLAEKFLQKNPGYHNSLDFNVLYELVYYYEYLNNFPQVQQIINRIERNASESIPIQRTVKNFLIRFGLLEDAARVDQTIKNLIASKHGKIERFADALEETDEGVASKIKELYSQVEHQARLTAISDLSTGISHELGQPITNIRYTVQYYSTLLKKKPDINIINKVFNSILEETERMGDLIKRLSPITSSKSTIETFDIVNRIEKRVAAEEALLKNNNISVEVFPSSEIAINCDPVKFDQVISNLLLNSIDAIKDKGEHTGTIKIHIRDKGQELEILFADSGVGIPAKNRGKVFDPFFSTKEPGKGQGLGLFIVWNILKILGGKVSVDPKYNSGTQFIISLPNI